MVQRTEETPVVSLRWWWPAGIRCEPSPGAAWVTARSLLEGASGRSWSDLAGEAEALGVSAASGAGLDVVEVEIVSLADAWRPALDLLATVVREPDFPPDRWSWVVAQAEAELASLADHPDAMTGLAFRELLYAPHPAGRPPVGTVEGLGRLEPADGRRLHRAWSQAGGVLVVAGPVDEVVVEEAVRQRFEPLATGRPPTAEPLPAEPSPVRRTIELPGAEQAHLFVGARTVGRTDPDLPPLLLLGVILGSGSGLTGRITTRVREREGLAYDVQTATVSGAGFDPGRFEVYVGTAPEEVERAEGAVREELRLLVDAGVRDDEVERARAFLLGRDAFATETASQRSELAATARLYGLPYDDPGWRREVVESVTRSDVDRVARRYLDPDRCVAVVGRPEEGS